ncbi:hypothetical protein FWD20_03990 [Candidatus Saccharibacteria bacterium]|nr:hypothetical protein [Candidatus Saccharibacteria bacterium]
MTKFFRGGERGAVAGYAISVVVLVVVLIGGVLLLKNFSGSKTDKPVAVETGEFKADDAKTNETKTETTEATNAEDENDKKAETTVTTTTETETVATTGATGHAPEKLTATGPEDFLPVVIGLTLVSGVFYLAWDYKKSRSTLRAKLLQK